MRGELLTTRDFVPYRASAESVGGWQKSFTPHWDAPKQHVFLGYVRWVLAENFLSKTIISKTSCRTHRLATSAAIVKSSDFIWF